MESCKELTHLFPPFSGLENTKITILTSLEHPTGSSRILKSHQLFRNGSLLSFNLTFASFVSKTKIPTTKKNAPRIMPNARTGCSHRNRMPLAVFINMSALSKILICSVFSSPSFPRMRDLLRSNRITRQGTGTMTKH